MADQDLKKELDSLLASKKYDNLNVQSANFNEENGQFEMRLGVTGGPQIADLPQGVEVVSTADLIPERPILPVGYESANRSLMTLDPLSRGDLDLLKPSVLQDTPQALYQRSIDYYRCKDVYGAHINVLTNFASKGFENDIDDPVIKSFYDSWNIDVNFDDFVDKCFFDFFRVGMIRTYKILGKYEPKIGFSKHTVARKEAASLIKEKAIHRNRFSKDFIPIGYTILNPTRVVIKGALLFGQTATFLKRGSMDDLKVLLEMPKSKLSKFQRKIIESTPASLKKAVLKNEDIPLDPDLVGEIDYRRMPYERYPLPRASRAFEAVEFKDELRKADYSTLDGITNYILLIRIGSDDHPVKKQETLDRVSDLFDTVSKSYKVVWNHTLNVEKVTSPEIGEILGEGKYKQVNGDITGGIGIIRALIDGLGDSNTAATELAVKSVIEEINYARRQVSRWIYKEYRDIAEVMGFDRIPRIRFDDMALRDEIQMMSIVQGMIDRRIISYRTGQRKLGFDPDTELSHMEEERPLVESGVLGIQGSPFQQSGQQQNQGTPKGTPSEGRPKGKPAPTPKKKDETKPTGRVTKRARASEDLQADVSDLTLEQLMELVEQKQQEQELQAEAKKKKKKKPYKKRKAKSEPNKK